MQKPYFHKGTLLITPLVSKPTHRLLRGLCRLVSTVMIGVL